MPLKFKKSKSSLKPELKLIKPIEKIKMRDCIGLEFHNQNPLEIKLDNMIYLPELWDNASMFQKVAGYPFFASLFSKGALLSNTEYTSTFYCISKFEEKLITQYWASDLMAKGNNAIKNILENKQDYIKYFNKSHRQLLAQIRACERYIHTGRPDFFSIWVKTQKVFCSTIELFCFSYALENYLKNLKENDKKEYDLLSISIVSAKKSFINEASAYLQKLIEENQDFNTVYKKFIEKYGWFQNSYLGANNITKEWLQIFSNEALAEKMPQKIENKRVNKNYKNLVKTASEAISYQDDKKRLNLITISILSNWLTEISRKTKLSYDELLWLSVDEILDYNLNSKADIKKIKLKIKKYANAGKRYVIMTKKGYCDIPKEFFEKVVELNKPNEKEDENQIIRGQAACGGNKIGVIRIVLNPHKSIKFDKGDILVTSMTRPEFVPLMKMAGAIITNEGGITCHAAIISRELNIPCIVGTKIATEILKNGDKVEVDANKGIIKVLKRFDGKEND